MTATEKIQEFLREAESNGAMAFSHYSLIHDGLLILAAEMDALVNQPGRSSKPALPNLPTPPKG